MFITLSLINRGLDRTYDGQIVKLLLGQDGIVDRSSVDTTSSDGSMSAKPIVVDRARLRKHWLIQLTD